MEDAVAEATRRIAADGASCTPDIRAIFVQRRPEFERMIYLVNGSDTATLLFAKLGDTVDADGNVKDK
jgi:hypothetical protein